MGEHDVTRTLSTTSSAPSVRGAAGKPLQSHISPCTEVVERGFFVPFFFFYQRRTCTGRQIDKEGGAQLRCRRRVTLCSNPVLPGRRSSPQPFPHSKCEPDLKERTVKKNALCFLFNHTLLDVITPFLCLTTRAVWTEARYSSSQTPDCVCPSEASWRR